MNARRVAKELENLTRGLNRNLPAVPPNLSKEEVKQVNRLNLLIVFKRSTLPFFLFAIGGVVEEIYSLRKIKSFAY